MKEVKVIIEHETAEISLDENGHVWFKFTKDAKVDMEHMDAYVDIMKTFCEEQKRCFILDARGTHATGTSEARKFIGSNPKALQYRKADVILLDNLAVKIVGNFYQKVDSKDHPVRLFSNERKALEWLKQF